MKKLWLFLVVCLAAASLLSLTACGGGGGGSAPVVDADSDGIPATSDADDSNANVFVATTPVNDSLGGPATGGALFSSASAVSNTTADGTLVVGVQDEADGTVQASVWTVSTLDATSVQADLTDLEVGGFSAAYDVNSAGMIVGESTRNGATEFIPVVWLSKGDAANNLGLGAGNVGGAAYSINSSNMIAGEVTAADGSTSAVFWTINVDNTITGPVALTTDFAATQSSSAYFIDDTGQIVGEATDGNGVTHAVVWTVAAGAQTAFADLLDTATELESVAFGINTLGQIVGEYENNTGIHAAAWTVTEEVVNGVTNQVVTRTDLSGASDSSTAFAVNENTPTQTVGVLNGTAVLWDSRTASPTMAQNLTSATDAQAHDINDEGVVAGIADNQVFITITQ